MLSYDHLMCYKFEGDNLPSLSTWIRFAIRKTQITQYELARRIGTTANNISMWINGRQKFPAKYIFKLAEVFNVDPLYLRNIHAYQFTKDIEMYNKLEEIRHLDWITENELEFIKIIRKVGGNPKLENDNQKAMFEIFLKTLPPDVPNIKNEPESTAGVTAGVTAQI